MFNSYSNISIKTSANALDAETKALHLLRKWGFSYVQQIDWLAKNDNGEWLAVEVKDKELFTPGSNFPHYGIGLNRAQLFLRHKLLEELGFRTYLINFVPGTDEVYGAYLDELEGKGKFFDSKNHIRIYPLSSFTKLTWGGGGNG